MKLSCTLNTRWIKTKCHSAKVTGRRARKVEGGVFFVSMSHHRVRSKVVFTITTALSPSFNPLYDGCRCVCMITDTPPLLTNNLTWCIVTCGVVLIHIVLDSHSLDWANEATCSVLITNRPQRSMALWFVNSCFCVPPWCAWDPTWPKVKSNWNLWKCLKKYKLEIFSEEATTVFGLCGNSVYSLQQCWLEDVSTIRHL